MRLMQNTTDDGQCKYAAVRMDKLASLSANDQRDALTAIMVLNGFSLWENPLPGAREEFFLVKLKDPRSTRALDAYADAAHATDPEFAAEVRQLAERSGEFNPFCKEPD